MIAASRRIQQQHSTFTARKLPVEDSGVFTGFSLHVTSLTDYYPFGSGMEGRTVTEGYRYGFNAMEREDDLYAPGSAYDFGARMYDGRLGRWWSVDPMVKEFAGSSAFAFAYNNPLIFLDKGGEYPITPEQMHAILSVFVQAVESYAKAAAKSNFSEKYLQTEASPPFIAIPLNVLPMYEPGEYNEGFGKAKILINDSYSISVKVIVNSPVNDSERSSTVVTGLKFEIGETGYFKDGKVNRVVLLAGDHRRVNFDLGNDLHGSMLVNFFKAYYDEVYNSAMYQEAIIADNVLGREYGSGDSFQEYFDAAKPEYRNARETGDKSMSVKEDQINIEINVDGDED